MLILVNKKLCTVDTVNGGHAKIDNPDIQLVFPNWLSFYLWLFKYHCLICGHSGSEIHHIIPRSHGEKSMDWRNRILLCKECHNRIHNDGINKINIIKLQNKRARVLRSYNREGFI